MIQIKIIGRGGQGGKKMSSIIAQAAFLEGKEVQSFALYGAERRGAPVTSFVRIDDKPIEIRGYIDNPNLTIVLDDSLINLTKGLTLCNSNKKDMYNVMVIDATQIALDIIGKPIFNTTMLGAFAMLGMVSLESIINAIKMEFKKMPEHIVAKNVEACKRAYEMV